MGNFQFRLERLIDPYFDPIVSLGYISVSHPYTRHKRGKQKYPRPLNRVSIYNAFKQSARTANPIVFGKKYFPLVLSQAVPDNLLIMNIPILTCRLDWIVNCPYPCYGWCDRACTDSGATRDDLHTLFFTIGSQKFKMVGFKRHV